MLLHVYALLQDPIFSHIFLIFFTVFLCLWPARGSFLQPVSRMSGCRILAICQSQLWLIQPASRNASHRKRSTCESAPREPPETQHLHTFICSALLSSAFSCLASIVALFTLNSSYCSPFVTSPHFTSFQFTSLLFSSLDFTFPYRIISYHIVSCVLCLVSLSLFVCLSVCLSVYLCVFPSLDFCLSHSLINFNLLWWDHNLS